MRQEKRKNAGKQPASKKALQAWYSMSAKHETSKGTEFEEADHKSTWSFWKSEEGKLTRKYRRGPMGLMDEALSSKNWDTYNSMRKKLVKPLRRDLAWDGGTGSEITVKQGEIPPPRFASVVATTGYRTTSETTRRGCALGVRGLPCNHPVGSPSCNGGVPLFRRSGDNY